MSTVNEVFGHDLKGLFFGTEYEIEGIVSHENIQTLGVYVEQDHSLRNNGYEYKTKPLTYEASLKMFEKLHSTIKYKQEQAFSDRTSIHVHMNVGSLSTHQVKQLVMFYTLLEPLFFSFVGPKREHSIFCVPLTHTALSKNYSNPIEKLVSVWSKYTAFNILPLKQFGTVEFRHLYGTNNFTTYKTWLSSLKELYEYIETNPEIHINKLLGTQVDLGALAKEVVPSLSYGFTNKEITEKLSDTVLDVKLSSGGL